MPSLEWGVAHAGDVSGEAAIPVVYLDQNHWVTLARARSARHKIDVAQERDAADWLLDLAAEGAIRLPLSVAHAYESHRARRASRRAAVIETMLDAYDGWHMKHPVDVRAWELRMLLGLDTRPPPVDLVFSRQPGSPFLSTAYVGFRSTAADLTLDQRRAVELLAWRSAWEATLRDGDTDEDARLQGEMAAARWSDTNQAMSDFVNDNPAKRDLRQVAATITLTDLTMEIATTAAANGMSPAQMGERLGPELVTDELLSLPFVGRTMELLHQRLQNRQTRWTGNDLTDVMFLCCAGAYADVVVCEKVTANDLTRAQRVVPSGAAIFANLRSLKAEWESGKAEWLL